MIDSFTAGRYDMHANRSSRHSTSAAPEELSGRAVTIGVVQGQSRASAQCASAQWMTTVEPPARRRPATRYDQDLLRAIFTDSRSSWFAALPIPLASALLEVQFRAHRNDRQLRWPDAVDQIIELHGVPAGRLTVSVGAEEIRIIDLALLPGFRRQGIGSATLADVKQEATRHGLPLRMTVAKQRDGLPLWPTRRMTVIGESDTDIELEA